MYITILDDGSGLNVSTKNINWCTEQMYKNALTTAGITDADVKVTAPFEVSGTAALTGIYKAYEDITGNSLSSLAKMVGAEELIVTGQLAEYIGSDEATALINELKGILDITETMSDADVKKEIKKLADQYNVQVTDGQIEQLLKLCRQLEKLGVDVIEAVFAIASPMDHKSVQAIAAAVTNCTVASLARCAKGDIDAAWDAVKEANHPRIHVFLATSDIHMEYKLKMTREQVIDRIREMVAYAKSYCDDIEFSAEDASRSDWAFLAHCYSTAVAAGATTLNVPDTVGYSLSLIHI